MDQAAEELMAKILNSLPGVFDDRTSLGKVCAAFTAIPEQGSKSSGEALNALGLTEAELMGAFYVVDEANPDDRPGVASQLNEILDKVQEFYCIEPPTA